jgi:hypothetical protein
MPSDGDLDLASLSQASIKEGTTVAFVAIYESLNTFILYYLGLKTRLQKERLSACDTGSCGGGH